MLNALYKPFFNCVSFCKYFFVNKKYSSKQKLIRKLKKMFLMHYITECVLLSDNYLITAHQARVMAQKYFHTPAGRILLRNAAAVLKECLR